MISKRSGGAALIASVSACLFTFVNLHFFKSGSREQPPHAVFVEVPDGTEPPELQLKGELAPGGDWLLHIETTHFSFTDVCVNRSEQSQIGHAHVHKGDRKIGTAYAPVFSLGHLAPGRHVFSVVLRAQDHRAVVSKEGLIHKKITIIVRASRKRRRLS
ncbi:MAG: hypothetical protein K5905_23275 [Roseibium sp.]|uniref:hypothetical protein n=1 Tax=Roseibium sp. TaxID=1936156 RepID=UPI0026294CF7|nr:hypothetical protein [Roseibium sp.]MCV0428390.1 hypothetical protein [Roseibium sp.]